VRVLTEARSKNSGKEREFEAECSAPETHCNREAAVRGATESARCLPQPRVQGAGAARQRGGAAYAAARLTMRSLKACAWHNAARRRNGYCSMRPVLCGWCGGWGVGAGLLSGEARMRSGEKACVKWVRQSAQPGRRVERYAGWKRRAAAVGIVGVPARWWRACRRAHVRPRLFSVIYRWVV